MNRLGGDQHGGGPFRLNVAKVKVPVVGGARRVGGPQDPRRPRLAGEAPADVRPAPGAVARSEGPRLARAVADPAHPGPHCREPGDLAATVARVLHPTRVLAAAGPGPRAVRVPVRLAAGHGHHRPGGARRRPRVPPQGQVGALDRCRRPDPGADAARADHRGLGQRGASVGADLRRPGVPGPDRSRARGGNWCCGSWSTTRSPNPSTAFEAPAPWTWLRCQWRGARTGCPTGFACSGPTSWWSAPPAPARGR